ncbi:DUF756 domain-containing protein [Komagataeibacter rhaeticus]|nr:DUF756 domain-containing protein [Komagataeibacter rhaeticus]
MRNDPAGLRAVLTQEAGTRPACALPYEPYCDGGLSGDGRRVAIRLRAGNTRFGARAAGVPFNIYRHGTGAGGGMQAGTYAVAAGDVLDTAFARTHSTSGRYDVDVHAPNGFTGATGDVRRPAVTGGMPLSLRAGAGSGRAGKQPWCQGRWPDLHAGPVGYDTVRAGGAGPCG